jgi:hypothetical protein
VLHCTATGSQPWDLHEFYVEGIAHPVDDATARQSANDGTGFPRDEHFVLFELEVASAFSTVFGPRRPTSTPTLALHRRQLSPPSSHDSSGRQDSFDHARTLTVAITGCAGAPSRWQG